LRTYGPHSGRVSARTGSTHGFSMGTPTMLPHSVHEPS
jgi:hypothetical protein